MFSVVHPNVVTSSAAQKNSYRVSKYQEYEHELNMSGIQCSIDTKDIGKFEHKNNISVASCEYEDKKNLPIMYYHCNRCKRSLEFIIYHCW